EINELVGAGLQHESASDPALGSVILNAGNNHSGQPCHGGKTISENKKTSRLSPVSPGFSSLHSPSLGQPGRQARLLVSQQPGIFSLRKKVSDRLVVHCWWDINGDQIRHMTKLG